MEVTNIDLIAEFISWLGNIAADDAQYPCVNCPASNICTGDCEEAIKKFLKGVNQ